MRENEKGGRERRRKKELIIKSVSRFVHSFPWEKPNVASIHQVFCNNNITYIITVIFKLCETKATPVIRSHQHSRLLDVRKMSIFIVGKIECQAAMQRKTITSYESAQTDFVLATKQPLNIKNVFLLMMMLLLLHCYWKSYVNWQTRKMHIS